MATISSQTTRSLGATSAYAGKDSVAISAIGTSVEKFDSHCRDIRVRHARDGWQPALARDENGKRIKGEDGQYVVATDSVGNTMYEPKYVQGYSLVQSFGADELDPDDPESWARAQQLGRAVAEDRFPGYPALVATEINGRSGLVHNHLVIGATHPETGRQIDGNVVTHARLAIEHDRILLENGFEQRADMREAVADAKARMARVRAQVEAQWSGKISESALSRKITAAENTVKIRSASDTGNAHEDRRRRELDRHQHREVDRAIAREVGIPEPRERFSELVLESRIRDAIADPRSTSWEALGEVGRTHGVTIERRGKDVTYGALLERGDGTVAEPARAHRRRGSRLGEGYRVADVEQVLQENSVRQSAPDWVDREVDAQLRALEAEWAFREERQRITDAARYALAEGDVASQPARDHPTDEMAVPELDESTATSESAGTDELVTVEPPAAEQVEHSVEAPEQPWRSALRDVTATRPTTQRRVDVVAELEEEYRDRPTDAEFESRVNAVGVGQQFLSRYGAHLAPQMRATLEARVAQAADREKAVEQRGAVQKQLGALKASTYTFGDEERRDKTRKTERDRDFYAGYVERIDAARAEGDYSPRTHERDEHATREKTIRDNAQASRVAEMTGEEPVLQPVSKEHAKVLELAKQQGQQNARRKEAAKSQDYGLGM